MSVGSTCSMLQCSVCRYYQLMKECWQYKQSKRPTFDTIRARLAQLYSPGNRKSVYFYYDTNQLSG